MRFALLKYGFKVGFRDVTDKQLRIAAITGAFIGITFVFVAFIIKSIL